LIHSESKEIQYIAETQKLTLPVLDLARENDEFRKVLWRGDKTQLVLMAIPAGDEIGETECDVAVGDVSIEHGTCHQVRGRRGRMIPSKVDSVIIGAGIARLSAFREVRRYTDDFLLVNDGHWGTTCAAVGCMPSKALIEVANAFHRRSAFDAFGIRGAEGLRADIPAVLTRVRRMRDAFVKGPESVPEKLGDRALSSRKACAARGAILLRGRQARVSRICRTARRSGMMRWTDAGSAHNGMTGTHGNG